MWQGFKNFYHLFQAIIANFLYGFPARKITVIGVTGTDGKTTTVNLIYHILKTAGFKVSIISTVSSIINDKTYEFGLHVTTPDVFTLQKNLRQAVNAGSQYMVLEVTSHALDQHRVFGIPFAVGVLTNITREHFDYHRTYKNYVNAKFKLLKAARLVVINRDDQSYEIIQSKVSPKGRLTMKKRHKLKVTYGIRQNADITPTLFPFNTKMVGEFNKYNILAAIAACRSLGLKDEIIRKGIETFQPPVGRVEIVHDNEFTVIIDFAHTPNALYEVLRAVREIMNGEGRLIHVFGSAGERDKGKRPHMGEVAARLSDIIILTADDPRSESVEKISDDIAKGITFAKDRYAVQVKDIYRIPNRQEAINEAIALAMPKDFVILTGVGHARGMPVAGKEIPWSEHKAVSQALKSKFNEKKI